MDLSQFDPRPDVELADHDMDRLRHILRHEVRARQTVFRDHTWLRWILPNRWRVDADLLRSGHPSKASLRRLKRAGLRSILSLRGGADNTPNTAERVAAHDLGLELRFIRMRTGALPEAQTLLLLLDRLREMPKPMMVHCKSGADRTGLAVTLYRHVIKGEPLPKARRALAWYYAHFNWGRAGIVHALLDAYCAAHDATGIAFEDWVRTQYDPAALTKAYHQRSGRGAQ